MYIYPAVFTPEEGGYSVSFVDFKSCYTQGDDLADAFEMAQDVLSLTLYRMEEQKQPVPTPSDVKSITTTGSAFTSLVDADTMEYRKRNDSRAVKKTLTIPCWLNSSAENAGINFSQVLQEGLKQRLGVADQ